MRQILCLGGAHIGRMKTNWQCDSDGILKEDSCGNSGKSKPKMEFSELRDLNQAKGGKGESGTQAEAQRWERACMHILCKVGHGVKSQRALKARQSSLDFIL